jgi:hypothetical protein
MSKLNTAVHAHDHPIHKMIATQNHHKTGSLSQQELKEVRTMSRKLRKLKRQMFLKQVEPAPTPVDSFRSLIVGLAVEEEALEARRERSESSSRSSSISDTYPTLGLIQE